MIHSELQRLLKVGVLIKTIKIVKDIAFKTLLLQRPRLCLGAKHRGGVILK